MLLCTLFAIFGGVFGFHVGTLVALTIGARRRRGLVEEVEQLRAERRARRGRPGPDDPARMRAMFN